MEKGIENASKCQCLGYTVEDKSACMLGDRVQFAITSQINIAD